MADITSFQKPSLGQTFFYKWILVNALGGLLGWFVGLIAALVMVMFVTIIGLIMNLESQLVVSIAMVIGVITAALIIRGLVGVVQWFVLRRHINQATWWLFASAAGVIVGSGIGWILGGYAAMATIGAVAGAVQWLSLRRQVFRAGWWIVVSPLGLVVGNYMGEIIFGGVLSQVVGAAEALNRGLLEVTDAMRIVTVAVVIVAIALTLVGAIYGMVTGRLLIWLLQHPKIDGQIASDTDYSFYDSDGNILL